MSYFANQVILITGAANGIGRQLAKLMAAEGATIAAVDLEESGLKSLSEELSTNRMAWRVADVTQFQSIQDASTQLAEELGPITMLVANAGVGIETSALDIHPEDMETTIRVNLLGVSHSISAVLPTMIERQSGHVVALSSLASFRGMPRMAGYCASKSGVNALMEGYRVELRDKNIFFTTICPGWIRTNMTKDLDLPLKEVLELESAAKTMLEAIRNKRLFVAFPSRLVRQLRFIRSLPFAWADWLIARSLRKMKKK